MDEKFDLKEYFKNMKTSKRIIAIIMTMLTLMSICSAAMPVFAQEIVFSDDDYINEIVETEEEPYILSEDLTKREANVKHFLMSDGSYLAAQYDEPVHYENDNGEWIDYDNNLTKSEATETQEELFGQSTVYKTNNENSNIVFAEKSNSNTLVLIEDEKYPISWNYQSAKNSRIKVIENNEVLEGDDAFLTLDNIEKEVLYENFFPNVDLQYIVSPSGSKENIILKNKKAQNSFTISYNIGKLTANIIDEKTIELTDGETVHYIISAPYMYDANGEISEDLTMTVTKNKNGKLKIELVANREWLDDENRVYPVVIDPSVSETDLNSVQGYFVSSQQTGAHQGDNTLKVGTGISNFGTTYALIKLDEITEDAFADHTVYAKLNLPISTSATNSLRLYMYEITSDWSESSLSWNNMPSISTEVSDYANITSSSTKISFDISKLCTKWENDFSSNNGILIKTADSGNLSFKIDHTEPILTYQYVRTTGIDSAYPYTEYDMGSAGTVYVNNFSGNLVLNRTDISTTGEEYPYTHSMTYNSFAVTESQESLWWPSYKAGFNLLYTHIDEYGTYEFFDMTETAVADTYTLEENQYGWEKIKLTGRIEVPFLFGKTLSIPAAYDAWRYDGTEKCSFDKDGLVSQTIDIEVASNGTENGGQVIFSREATSVPSGTGYHITDGDGEKILVTIDGSNHTVEQVPSANSGNDKVRYISDTNGNIVSITLNDVVQATFTYDTRNRMTSVANNKGYKLTFEYDGNTNKISSVAESNGSVSGQKILIERSFNTAKVTTAGRDGVLGDNKGNDLVTTYRFNSLTELVSESYSTSKEGNIGSVSYEYTDGDEDESIFGNISRVASVGKNATNYLQNHNLESLTNWTPYKVDDSSCSYSAIVTQTEKYQGEKSVAVTVNDVTTTGGASVYQSFTPSSGELSVGEYIASAYVKTNGITRDTNADSTRNYGAAIMIRVATADGSSRYYSENIQKTDSTVDNGWERVFVTFEVPEDYTKVTMHLIVRNGTGTAYFDATQLEDGTVPSQYNMLENNAFTHTNSSNQATVWNRYNLTSSDIVNSEGNMYIVGDPDTKKGVYQDINLGDASQSDTYVLGAWAKATAVPKGSGRSFSVYPLVYYKDANGNTSSVQKTVSSFDVAYDEEMQYTSTSFDLSTDDESLVPYKVRILACYYRECNTAEFNSLSLIRTYDVEEYNDEDDGYTYDDEGNPLTYTDEEGNVYTYNYDNYGNLISRLNQNNEGDRYTYSRYNDKSYITSERYEDGTVTTYSYDLLFNLTGKTTVDGDTTYTYTYDSEGKVLTESTTPGKSYTYTYDSYDNLLSKLTSGGVGDRYTYIYNNDKGYIATETFEDGSTCSYIYDSSYNLTKTTSVSEDGVTSVCNYDSNGNLTTQKDSRDGNEVTYYYNDEGKITKVNHNGFYYNYTFDVFGNPTAVKVGSQNLVTYSYQPDLSKLASMTYGNGFTVSYNYNNFGEVSRITMGDAANYYGFKHNAMGNVIYERDTINSQRIYYQYDKEGTAVGERVYTTDVAHTYNNLLYSFADRFDDDGNLIKNIINVGGDDYSTSYSYTENEDESSTETTTISSSRKVIHNYDSNYKLISKNTTTTTPLNETFTYDDDGNVTQHIIGSDTYGYNYDDNGNITQITKNGAVRQSYVYDANNQLIRENNLDTNKTIIYTYDNGGNIANRKEYAYTTGTVGTATDTISYAYDSTWKDKLTSCDGQIITYDEIGNPEDYRDGMSFKWNGRQITKTKLDSDTTITYKYDSDGLRTQKVVNGVQYDYYYVAGQLRYEKKGSEYELVYRYNNDGTLASITRYRFSDSSTTTLYAVTNTRGDVIKLLNDTGTVNSIYTYDSWGKLISVTSSTGAARADNTMAIQSSIRYRGYVYDTETGLYYLQSRYYDPETGRFLNADDVDFIGASGTVLGNNAFAYCENNPVNSMDSSGAAVGLIQSMAIGALLGIIELFVMDIIYNLYEGTSPWFARNSDTSDYILAAVSGAISMLSFKKISTLLSGISAAVDDVVQQWKQGGKVTVSKLLLSIADAVLMDLILPGEGLDLSNKVNIVKTSREKLKTLVSSRKIRLYKDKICKNIKFIIKNGFYNFLSNIVDYAADKYKIQKKTNQLYKGFTKVVRQ